MGKRFFRRGSGDWP